MAYTRPLVIANAGTTVDRRELPAELLKEIAKNYNHKIRPATLNLGHKQNQSDFRPNLGEIMSLEFGDHPNAKHHKLLQQGALLARFSLNQTAMDIAEWANFYFSVEFYKFLEVVQGAYLAAAALVDDPASMGMTAIKFGKQNPNELIEVCSQFKLSEHDPQFFSNEGIATKPFSLTNDTQNTMTKTQTAAAQATNQTDLVAKPEPTPAEEENSLAANQADQLTQLAALAPALLNLLSQQANTSGAKPKLKTQPTELEKLKAQVEKLQAEKANAPTPEHVKELEKQVLAQSEMDKNSLATTQTSTLKKFANEGEVVEHLMVENSKLWVNKYNAVVKPAEQVKIIKRLQDNQNLISKINFLPVPAMEGRAIFAEINGNFLARKKPSHALTSSNFAFGEQRYRCQQFKGKFKLDQTTLLEWANTLDLVVHLRDLAEKKIANEIALGLTRGTAAAASSNDPLTLIKGFDLKLKDFNSGSNVLEEVEPGTGVVIVGNKRVMPLKNIDAKVVASPPHGYRGTLIEFTAPSHGFVVGGMVNIRGDANYTAANIRIHETSTADKLVLTAVDANNHQAFHADAILQQEPDYSSLDMLSAAFMSPVITNVVGEINSDEYEIWYGKSVALNRKAAVYGAVNLKPSETKQQNIPITQIDGFKTDIITYLKPDSMWLTKPKNLSLYEQIGSRISEYVRPQGDTDFVLLNSFHMDNVIENPQLFSVVNNLRFLKEFTG